MTELFLIFLRKKNCKVLGVDPALNVVKIARRKELLAYVVFLIKERSKKLGKNITKLC